jgi:hypothetical protein
MRRIKPRRMNKRKEQSEREQLTGGGKPRGNVARAEYLLTSLDT